GQLLGQLLVQRGHAGADRLRQVLLDDELRLDGLIDQRADQLLAAVLLLGLEVDQHLIEQAGFLGLRLSGSLGLDLFGGTHDLPSWPSGPSGVPRPSCPATFFSAASSLRSCSSSFSSASERSTLVSRSRSLLRVSSSLRSGSTCCTTRAGSKSSSELNFR